MHFIMVNAAIKDIYNEVRYVDRHKVYYIQLLFKMSKSY